MIYEKLWQRLTPIYDAGEAKAIVRMILEMRFGLSLTDILCGKVDGLSNSEQQALEAMMLRLEKGEPVQYVLGVADFCGRQFHVAPGVLIPRPETEELCRWICERWKEKCSILDIGTGSGCIAITLALNIPEAKVTAWDISDEALRIARENAKNLGAGVCFERQDILNISPDSCLLSPVSCLQTPDSCLQTPDSCYNLIVSNPPYINETTEREAMAQNVLDYEPHEALFAPTGQPDLFYRRIGDYAIQHLNPGGQLYFELNPLTADGVRHYLENLGFRGVEIRLDQFGKQRMLKAIKPNQI